MKVVYCAIASLCFVTSSAVAVTPVSGSTPSIRISQASNQPDMALLAKVIQQFLKNASYETISEIRVSSVTGNTTVQTSAQVRTIAQYPNKFRSEITFANPDKPGTTVTAIVISNGSQVWLYRPDLKQYQVMTFKQFDNFDDSYWLGFSNLMFTQAPAELRQFVSASEANSAQLVQAIGLELKDLQGATQNVNNQALYVYQYKDPKENFTYSAFVDQATAAVQRFQIAGRTDGTDVVIIENIVNRTSNPTIAATTFTFSPPAGTKQVKTLAIGPL